MRGFLALILVTVFVSCSNDDKAIDIVNEELEYGAVIRTLSFNNSEFNINNTSSVFSVEIEMQDKENGDLLESVDVYAAYLDNTPAGGNFSKQEVFIKKLMPEDFTNGPNGLPRMTLETQYNVLANALGVSQDLIACKDQFLVRLVVNLTDGRSFTTGTASSIILAYETFFSSPYCYTINVTEPLEEDLFTGTYRMSSVLDGPLGATFEDPGLIEITKAPHSNAVRQVLLKHRLSHPTNELPRIYEFSIVCDEVVFRKNQLSSVIGYCSFNSSQILLGPGEENAPANLLDDSVFEIWFVEGYLGFDGNCGFGTAPSRIRFTKQ